MIHVFYTRLLHVDSKRAIPSHKEGFTLITANSREELLEVWHTIKPAAITATGSMVVWDSVNDMLHNAEWNMLSEVDDDRALALRGLRRIVHYCRSEIPQALWFAVFDVSWFSGDDNAGVLILECIDLWLMNNMEGT